MSLSGDVYEKMPIWGQNVAISIYGMKLYYERYFNSSNYFQDLMKSQWLSKEQTEIKQIENLKNILTVACNNVPYYKKLFQHIDMQPEKIKNINDIHRIPLLEKETIRENTTDLLSRQYKKGDLIELNTSGTTGKSLKVYVDLESRRRSYAFTSRYHRWAGLESGRNNATFGGRAIIPQKSKSNVFWRYNAIMNNHYFSSYHMSDGNLKYYVNKLKKLKLQFIEGYPSAVYLLAKYMEENNIDGIYPRAVITSGETLFEHQRAIMEKMFKCKVFDQYGCTEQGLFISQCEKGTYHVHPEYGIVEILGDDDKPVSPGSEGRVVCTSFMNMAMPLIRYNLGDIVSAGDGRCACNRNFPIIRNIHGRKDDYILTPDGKFIGRLDPVFKGIDSIKMAQIVQENISKINLFIVPGNTFNDDDKHKLLVEMEKRIGNLMEIEVHIVDEIEKTRSGKIKSVISKISYDKRNLT